MSLSVTRAVVRTVGLSMAVAACAVRADDLGREYLQQLRATGFADWGVDFLKLRQATKRLPADLVDTVDIELAECYRTMAEESTSVDAAERKLDDAVALLEKFLKENPQHEQAVSARAGLGDVALQRGQLLLRLAPSSSDKARRLELFDRARGNLKRAADTFASVARHFETEISELEPEVATKPAKQGKGKATKRPAKTARRDKSADLRQKLEGERVEAQFKQAKAEFFSGQTFADAADPKRKEILAAAAASFDAIYQRYRTAEVGLYAHMWHGKAEDEQGNLQTALDIYDEVLVNAPDPGQKSRFAGFETLFAQVEYFRLLVVARQGKTAKFETEAADWLKRHRASRATSGYQGIALALAKSLLQTSDKSPRAEQRKRLAEATRWLDDVAKTKTEHQAEAILLVRQQRAQSTARPEELATYEEAMTVGESLLANGAAANAIPALTRAVELAGQSNDKPKQAAARLRIAAALYAAGKPTEAYDAAFALAKDDAKSPSAAPAAALTVSIAYALYFSKPDDAALQRLTEAADFAIATWPGQAEADEARIALGQVKASRRDFAAAVALLDKVDPKSPSYPLALQMAGQTYWQQYKSLRNPTMSTPQADLARLALEKTKASLNLQNKGRRPDDPMPRSLVEAQVLLAEILFDARDVTAALALLKPLVDAATPDSKAPLDPLDVRLATTAFRAYLTQGDLNTAERIVQRVVQRGSDSQAVNLTLLDFAGQCIAVMAKRPEQAEAARKIALPLLDQLADRKELPWLTTLGDYYQKLGVDSKASAIYLRLLSGPKGKDDSNAATQAVRLKLAGLLLKQGRFDEANQQVDRVIKAYPQSLEPQIVKGKILLAWCEKDPSHCADGVRHFTQLRARLAGLQKRPPEYFEAIYGAAFCLHGQWRQTGDVQKQTQAKQLLKATMTLSPNLSGPEMRAKYADLLKSLSRT